MADALVRSVVVFFIIFITSNLIAQESRADRKRFFFHPKHLTCLDRWGNSGLNQGTWGECISLARKKLFKGNYKARMGRPGLSLAGSDLEEANLSNLWLRQVDLRGINLRNAKLNHVVFEDVNLTGADLRGAVGTDVTFIGGSENGKYRLQGALFDHKTFIREEEGDFIDFSSFAYSNNMVFMESKEENNSSFLNLKGGVFSKFYWDSSHGEGNLFYGPFGKGFFKTVHLRTKDRGIYRFVSTLGFKSKISVFAKNNEVTGIEELIPESGKQ